MHRFSRGKATHSDKLESWLGADVVANISANFRNFDYPVALHGVPGKVYVMPGGDFAGEIKTGFHFTKEDMIELFFVDAVQQHAYLFDVSGVTMSARDESRALAEIQLAIQALRSVFPEVGDIDNAQPPLQTHSATLPDSADEVFPGSF